MTILTLLAGLSTAWGTRLVGYEAFRKLHSSLAMVYVGACWGLLGPVGAIGKGSNALCYPLLFSGSLIAAVVS